MIKSMTGYGSAKGIAEGLEICVELKSVNNRYLDTSVRLPRSFLFVEDAVKSSVQSHISRGKVDMFITYEDESEGKACVRYNEEIAAEYKLTKERIRQIEQNALHKLRNPRRLDTLKAHF